MLKVALVGNIASGKSTVAAFLRDLGYPVLDTDKVCHELIESLQEVKTFFRNYDVFDLSGNISRDKLGRLVFDNLELKVELEKILYPALEGRILDFFKVKSKINKMVFVAIPLLFEAGMEKLFDKILFVYCEDSIRLERLIARNGYDVDYAKKRISYGRPGIAG